MILHNERAQRANKAGFMTVREYLFVDHSCINYIYMPIHSIVYIYKVYIVYIYVHAHSMYALIHTMTVYLIRMFK